MLRVGVQSDMGLSLATDEGDAKPGWLITDKPAHDCWQLHALSAEQGKTNKQGTTSSCCTYQHLQPFANSVVRFYGFYWVLNAHHSSPRATSTNANKATTPKLRITRKFVRAMRRTNARVHCGPSKRCSLDARCVQVRAGSSDHADGQQVQAP